MAQYAAGEPLHVVGDHIVAAVERGGGAGGAGEQARRARTRAAFEVGTFAGRAHQPDDIVDDLVGQADGRDRVDRGADRRGVGNLPDAEIGDHGAFEAPAMFGHDAPLLVGVGIIDDQLEQEAVELRLG